MPFYPCGNGTTQGMSSEAVERRTFSARLDCHYLLRPTADVDGSTLLVAALHGFGSNPEVMLRLTEGLLGSRPVIASVQAPSQFFLSQRASEVGSVSYTHLTL